MATTNRDPDRYYQGVLEDPSLPMNSANQAIVLVEHGRTRPLNPRLDVANKSPTGLSWGYWGSGPSQAALAILCDAVGKARALPLYQQFKQEIIGNYSQSKGWQLPVRDVLDWVRKQETVAMPAAGEDP